jgi:hypothetical protein
MYRKGKGIRKIDIKFLNFRICVVTTAFVFVPSVSNNREGIFKLLRIPGIDSKESIPPAYVDWRTV